jgi:diguanylate cyclase
LRLLLAALSSDLTVFYHPGATLQQRFALKKRAEDSLHRPEREQALAKTALALMGELNVVPAPDNFELFYAYASGENPVLAETIDRLIKSRRAFTAEILQELRQRCHSTRPAQVMDNFGSGISEVIAEVMSKLEEAGRDAVDYSNALSAVSGGLKGTQSPADLRKLVDGLIAATREMEGRTRSLESELQRSSEQVTDLRSKLDNVRKESLTDPLTGIANRKAFDTALEAAFSGAKNEPVTLLLCDIDHFKKFNDSWGHQTGDQVLKLVASCLAENIKGRDTAARYGGEEFAVLLRGSSLFGGAMVANQIRETVQARKLVKKSTGEVLGTITISIGVAQLGEEDTAESLIRRADACLYGAKSHGRNLVVHQNDPRMAALEVSAA